MVQSESALRDQVREKLAISIGVKSPEDLCRIFYFLDEKDDLCRAQNVAAISAYWTGLNALLRKDVAFENFAERLADDTRSVGKDHQFQNVMYRVYCNYKASVETAPEVIDLGFELLHPNNVNLTNVYGFAGLEQAWHKIPSDIQSNILAFIAKNATGSKDVKHEDKEGTGTYWLPNLEAINSIRRKWLGDMTGKRCVNVTSAAAVGVCSGAVLGTCVAGLMGKVVGGVLGGIGGIVSAKVPICNPTQWFIPLRRNETLENAYSYLGVKHNAPIEEVNAAFRRLCLMHHPDKGGDKEEFHILQNHMTVIKIAQEESNGADP